MTNIDSLTQFNKLVAIDSEKARAIILKMPYQEDAYLLKCIAQTYIDEAMFFKNGNLRKFFVSDKLMLAKKYIDEAFSLKNNCRDVLYTKGIIYNAIGDKNTAINCYILIIDNADKIDYEYNCSNSDLQFIKMIVNDSYFQLYRLFYDIKNFTLSKKLLLEYKKGVKKGIETIYVPLENYLME